MAAGAGAGAMVTFDGLTPPPQLVGQKRPNGTTPTRRTSARLSAEPVASPLGRGAATSALSPGLSPGLPSDRKIWMRACNQCGQELHVRRTKCTECGALQQSKRAAESAVDAGGAAPLHKVRMPKDAERAASSLARIAEGAADAQGAADGAAEGAADASERDALALLAVNTKQESAVREARPREARPLSAPGGSPSTKVSQGAPLARSQALAAAVARLPPAARAKLRRFHKLRSLLARLPEGVAGAKADGADGAAEAAGAAPAAADAISMLASVACM